MLTYNPANTVEASVSLASTKAKWTVRSQSIESPEDFTEKVYNSKWAALLDAAITSIGGKDTMVTDQYGRAVLWEFYAE